MRGKRRAGYIAKRAAMLLCFILIFSVAAIHMTGRMSEGFAEDDTAKQPLLPTQNRDGAYAPPSTSASTTAATAVPTVTPGDTTSSESAWASTAGTEMAVQSEDTTAATTDQNTSATTTSATTTTTTAATTAPDAPAAATTAPAVTTVPTQPVDPNIPVVNEYGIYSRYALLVDLKSGERVFSLLPDERAYPASLTKIMTAILVIEMCEDLDKTVTITADMLYGLKEAGASLVGYKEGESASIRELLYGLMLPSGADASNAAAVAVAGSVGDFVTLMNDKAAAIGMTGTRFTNTHGLHDKNLYSTASDLAALLTYALQNSDFRAIFSTGSYVTAPTTEHPEGIKLTNNMTVALGQNPLSGGRVIGNKTGFTTPAGQCLASLAVVGGREYILITLNAGKNGYNTQRYNMLDALTLYGDIG